MMFDGWNPHSFGVSFMEIQMFFGDFMVFFFMGFPWVYMMG